MIKLKTIYLMIAQLQNWQSLKNLVKAQNALINF